MDFSLTEEQEAVAALARQILEGQVTQERLKELEAAGAPYDERTWAELAKAGLLGIALPEEFGGAGLGFLEVCRLLEQVGRTVAPVPVLPATVMGALPIASFGDEAQRRRFLPPAAEGGLILTSALVEAGTSPAQPATTARRDGRGWRLDGVKVCVPAGLVAERMLVPARTGEDGVGVFLLGTGAEGVRVERQDTTSGIPEARLELTGTVVAQEDVLGDPADGGPIVEWIVQRATAATCAVMCGVCEEALRLTAEYTKTREQFDRPIATFQAVSHRAADAYVDAEAIRLTALQAAWRLSAGLPSAEAVAVAKFWAAEGGQRVVHAAQHLHGGIGVDRDYPLHRYFLWAKHLELTLGGATPHLLRLGAMLAAEPA